MGATGWLIRRRLRRRWVTVVPLALIVGCGATGSLVALGAAERTAYAYERYLERADIGDVVINPSLLTTEIDAVIRALPGVRSATSDTFFLAALDPEGDAVQVRGSVDGRYRSMDRPALAEGRYPSGTREALASVEMARARDIEIGDVVPVYFGEVTFDYLDPPDAEVSILGVEHVEVVGLATFPDEVLPDVLYPRERILVSSDVAARYDCLPDPPPRQASFDEASSILLRERCATAYRYYSLRLEGGQAGAAAALDAFERAAVELNAELPTFTDDPAYPGDGDPRYFLIPTTTAQQRERVERSVQPTVAALAVLGGAAGAITVIVAGLAVARELRRNEADQRQWWQLGMTGIDRSRVILAPLLIAVAGGLAAAVVLAWWLSPVGPVGTVRSVDPAPARQVSSWGGLGVVALAGVLFAGIVVVAFRQSRRVVPTRARRGDVATVRRLVGGTARPEVGEGIRAAYVGRGSALVMTSGAVAAAVLLAALVFGASLTALVSTPRSYGWPWDLAIMGGYGYGGMDLDAVGTTLGGSDDVESWTGLGFPYTATLNGESVLAVIGFDRASEVDPAVVEGRLPAGADEVALGTRTAAERGIGVGDEVELGGDPIEPRRATVTGLVVLPALGPYQADRMAPGTGILLPEEMVDATALPTLLSFVGIGLVPGADVEGIRSELHEDIVSWDPTGEETIEYVQPVLPAELVDAPSMRALPLIVGGLLGSATVVGLVFAVVVSVHSRRRDLAVLRALGFTGRQIRDSVRVQAVATMVAALAAGVPLGIVIGRLAWRTFAGQLGVLPEPSIPGLWLAATVAGALAVALLAAAVPARLAARVAPAAVLRSE